MQAKASGSGIAEGRGRRGRDAGRVRKRSAKAGGVAVLRNHGPRSPRRRPKWSGAPVPGYAGVAASQPLALALPVLEPSWQAVCHRLTYPQTGEGEGGLKRPS